MSLLLSLYAKGMDLAGPLLIRHLKSRVATGKEDADRLGERYGETSLLRPAGKLVWCHAASVGEAMSLLPLVKALLAGHPDLHALVTSGTLTSAAILKQRLPPQAFHQFVPLDRPAWVRRFLDHWRPDLVLWIESEIWPNFLTEIGRRAIPAALVNGRLSVSSARWWQLVAPTLRQLLGVFTVRLAQSEADRERWDRFLPFTFAGNLKFAVEAPPADPSALAGLRELLAGRPIWLAANTHADEEARSLAVHADLHRRYPGLLTIVVPRHPERGSALRELAEKAGLSVALRSENTSLSPATDIYIADTLGELGTFYELAPIAYIGGSFGQGGHSPVEAALLGNAIVFGPDMRNNAGIATLLRERGAAMQIEDTRRLTEIIDGWLRDPAAAAAMAEKARTIAVAEAQVLPRVLAALAPLLSMAGLAP
jgi:3-deoxy-D-manno-octulosonic-acid transferase